MGWSASLVSFGVSDLDNCDDGITCATVEASGFIFNCRFAGPEDGKPVLMLHGFPEWSDIFMDLMRQLDDDYYSVACNQRGYSMTARPDGLDNYYYDNMVDDVFAMADAVFGEDTQFHLIAHDHGAVQGWVAAGSDDGSERLLSYTSLSIPHPDAFSAGLYGDDADYDQQMASQYFSMFVLDDSASLENSFWYYTMGATAGGEGFDSADEFQKALWWYTGAMNAGTMAFPPVISSSDLLWNGWASMAILRSMYGDDSEYPNGKEQGNPIGTISVPSLYVCGSSDTYIFCGHDYALTTEDYVVADYTYLEVDCGHDLLTDCGWWGSETIQTTMDAIQTHLDAN